MRAVVQRVHSARVEIDSQVVSAIEHGLLVFIGFSNADSSKEVNPVCKRILNIPLFVSNEDTDGPSNLNVMQKNYELLIVSQFSLYGVFKGNRMDFHDVMPSEQARPLYDALLESFGQLYDTEKIKDGHFGVKRQVFLVNNGPLAFQIDSESLDITESG